MIAAALSPHGRKVLLNAPIDDGLLTCYYTNMPDTASQTVHDEDDPFDEVFLDPETVIRERDKRKAHTRRSIKYVCSECGRDVGRGNLKVKRAQFLEMGIGGSVVRTRVVAWLCILPADDGGPSCLDRDPAWNRAALVDSPGMSDVKAKG